MRHILMGHMMPKKELFIVAGALPIGVVKTENVWQKMCMAEDTHGNLQTLQRIFLEKIGILWRAKRRRFRNLVVCLSV
ncbi:hypothetical protein MT325_m624L [Paramecium bursaria chlorella virus MT325]|uniref:Uncharacterized protein m624L n=1 Tax=Paramecium bursaria Chlorella virus MT325 TaxID=346932 RepID=A7IV04_PBCVM|nr:hypothetical protein MT325_m624L [Paramecium bursaria chlorella virus MT325]